MQDWFLESLRRSLVCAVFVLIAALVDIWQIRIASFVALVVFLCFLVRNPDGWARRLSYACTMFGAGMFIPLGTAIKATGWLKAGGAFQNAEWLGGMILQFEQGSPWFGAALIMAGIAFGVMQVVREHLAGLKKEPTTAALSSQANHLGNFRQKVDFVVPVKNSQPHNITIRTSNIEPLRWLDHILVKNLTVADAVTLDEGSSNEQVELPATVLPNAWKRLRIQVTFTDRIGSPTRWQGKLLFWLLGLHRRYLRLRLEEVVGDRLFQKTLIVFI